MSSLKMALFVKGAGSICRLAGTEEKTYACPLCLGVFGETALGTGELTLEHVPPASLGGSGIVLTCHTCNSKAGHTIEAQLHRQEEVRSFVKALGGSGHFTGRIRLNTSGTSTNAEASIEDGGLKIDLLDEINNPNNLREQSARLHQMAANDTWDGYQFEVSPVIEVNPRVASLSYLKIGYLAAFASLGYRYILRKELEIVREQVARPKEKIIPTYMIQMPADEAGARKMIGVKEPIAAIAVQVDRNLVFLPPVEPSKRFYESLPGVLAEYGPSIKLSGFQWPFPNGLDLALDQ